MFYQQIENCDNLGYCLINAFISMHPTLAQEYSFEKVIYTRDNIYNGYKYYRVFILIIKNKSTNHNYILKFSNKLRSNSSFLEQNEKNIILKEYLIHQNAIKIDPEHTLNIYNHWIFSYPFKNDYYHYSVILMEKGHPLDKLYLNKKIINRNDFQKFVITIYLDVLHILCDYEKKHLLHRDIKPQNIYLADGKVKIGDFDCSKIDFNGTQYQTSIITPIYAAPEVYSNRTKAKYGSKSQVFSIAVAIAVTLNKGELLGVSKKEANQILTNPLNLNEYNLNKYSPKFTQLPLINKNDPLNQILQKGLSFNPIRRPNMYQFAKELERYLANPKQETNNYYLLISMPLLILILLLFVSLI